ncbi:unnamed protein product [Hyaloperonospora brassicae]|uniref:AB hydrolase-1 domain-containing protein n=1 Tax=Hyaloperonospora brassicae TaxID=162125 RepID=A0AAV0TVW1_HYABA|nr:unnamed protein product [Hyaloperonospora brassicae]
MHLRLVLSIAAAGVIGRASAASNTTAGHTLAQWDPCQGFTFDAAGESDVPSFNAECMVFAAPLCYPGVCEAPANVNPNIEIFVKRVAATAGDAKNAPNLLLVPGGPGVSSETLESALDLLSAKLGGAVNVYLMEHRGTGRSTRLDCVASQSTTTGSPSGLQVEPSEVPACAQVLQETYGSLASFSTTSGAMDLATFISEYTNGAPTFVFGRSYGTAVIQRLMQLNPPTVTGYVLDSVMATAVAPDKKFYHSSRDTMFGEVGEQFMNLCAQDSNCAAQFKDKSLSATLHDLLAKFDSDASSTCAALVAEYTKKSPSAGLRDQLGSILNNQNLRSLIAPLVYRFNRCDPSDVPALTQFLQINTEEESRTDVNDALASKLLTNVIFFSEMWETPIPSLAELQTRFTTAGISNQAVYESLSWFCAYSKEQSAQCEEFGVGSYNANGIIYPHDQYWDKLATVPSTASVLLLAGGLDPLTPAKYTKSLFEALDTPNKELIVFDYSSHSVIASTPIGDGETTCGFNLLISYVAGNGNLNSLDKSCMAQVAGFDMALPPDTVSYLFGTNDAYGSAQAPTGQTEQITPA